MIVAPMPKNRRSRDGATLFLAVLAFYAAVLGARAWWLGWSRAVLLSTGKPSYRHFELVDVSLTAREPALNERWSTEPPRAVVLRGGAPVTTIGGLVEVPLKFDAEAWAWVGRWPCPWNAPAGRYELALVGEPDAQARLRSSSFSIERRRPWKAPRGFSVVTLESVTPFRAMVVKTPDGKTKDWHGLLDWVEYVGADALWVLGGQTPGAKPGEVWLSHNLPMLPVVARECHRRGLKFGVYAMCYLTMSTGQVGGYEYARDVKDGRSFATRAISLRDPKRPRDVAALLKTFRDIPEVDFIGLDYVRNALGGYELADEFFADMGAVVPPPPEWSRWSQEAKMIWFARKKITRRDEAFIDAWQWWRAHKVGGIVAQIKREVGERKPLWAFTLTWDKGWHHGQDPVMMNDAGVDLDALMLYEADKPQFDVLINGWHKYVRRGDAQLLVGDVIDWPLHQKDPAGPAEFYRREKRAIDDIYGDGPAAGIFIHDLERALHGRTGPWGARGWLDEARRATRYFKSL